jgi:hypothetical protein
MRCEAEPGDEQHTGGPTADRMPGESCDQHGELNRGGNDEVYVSDVRSVVSSRSYATALRRVASN